MPWLGPGPAGSQPGRRPARGSDCRPDPAHDAHESKRGPARRCSFCARLRQAVLACSRARSARGLPLPESAGHAGPSGW